MEAGWFEGPVILFHFSLYALHTFAAENVVSMVTFVKMQP